MNNAEIFRKAADYIREYGLLQRGDAGYHGAPRCTIGAIESAVWGVTYPNPEQMERVITLGVLASKRATGKEWLELLFRWNDTPERTAEEVIALLEGLAFDAALSEDLKAAAQSPIKASVVTLHTPEPHLGLAPAASRHDAIIPSLEAVPV